MNICIVDDDRTTVERILRTIPWDQYGISEKYTAYDAQSAKKILSDRQIDLMLCDIQMPGLSGLGLMEWIRDQQMDVQVIFLTNYAEFSYAQKAMRLGSFDYICKGTDLDEVEKAIGKCTETIRDALGRARLQDMGERYVNNSTAVEKQFFHDLLTGAETMEENAGTEKGMKLPHPVSADTLFTVICAVFSLYAAPFHHREYEAAEQAVREIAATHYLGNNENAGVVILRGSERVYVYILLREKDDRSSLVSRSQFLCHHCSEEFGAVPTVYLYPEDCKAVDLGNIHSRIAEFDGNNVMRRDTVLRLEDLQYGTNPEEAPENISADFVREIREMVLKGRPQQEIQRRIRSELQEQMRVRPDRRSLVQFRLGVHQIVYSVLTEMGITLGHNQTEKLNAMDMKAADSVPDMVQWTDTVIAALADLLRANREAEDPAQTIKQYIDSHYAERMDRENIAEAIHVSPGYAARLFKEKYNISMNDYIQQVRLEKAAALLKTSKESIGEISQKCGFESAAYFTACFRKAYGVTPKKFRE